MKEMDRHKAAMEKIHEERLKPDVKLDKIRQMIKTEVARTIKTSEDIRKKYPEEAGRNAAFKRAQRQAKMSDEARELKLFIENDGDLYRQQHQPIIKNLTVKKAQEKYDSAKAAKLYMYLMDNGAKKYFKQFGSPGMKWMDMFPKKARMEAAKEFVEEFEEAFDDGEYDEYIPKKYRKKDAAGDVEAQPHHIETYELNLRLTGDEKPDKKARAEAAILVNKALAKLKGAKVGSLQITYAPRLANK
jgi:hypothetical protein